MKTIRKILIIIALFLLGSQVKSQGVKSCMDYVPNRSLQGFKLVVLTSKDPFMEKEMWPEYARLANNILKTSKDEAIRNFRVTPDRIGMQWLMDHTVEYEWTYYKQQDYHNGTKIGGNLVYRDILGHESNWATLEVGDVSGMYAKINCCNSEDPKVPLKRVEPRKNEDNQQRETNDGWNYQETQNSGRSMLVDEPIKPSYYMPTTTTETKKVVDWVKIGKIGGISVGIVGLGTAAYFIFRPHNKPGSPGGAPITHDPINPPDPPNPSGPGGAPITH